MSILDQLASDFFLLNQKKKVQSIFHLTLCPEHLMFTQPDLTLLERQLRSREREID